MKQNVPKGSYSPRGGGLGTFWKPPSQNPENPSQNPVFTVRPMASPLLRTLLRGTGRVSKIPLSFTPPLTMVALFRHHGTSSIYQKKRDVRKILVRNSGAGNGCANFMGAWSFCWKTPMPIKFLLLGGVLGFFRRGGGSANFIFMGVGIFPNLGLSLALLWEPFSRATRRAGHPCPATPQSVVG